ncbi:MAG: tandem-95 repeat protein [Proteobacteria bacterium]|nr:tandem-95 repeat protein [Pseudomonadota bacterium]
MAQETEPEQETPETSEDTNDPNAQTVTPAAGAPVIIVVNPGDVIPIAIAALAEADLSQDPDEPGNLIIALPDGTQVVLQGFFVMAATGLPPALSLADGVVIPAADVISAIPGFDPSTVATAAGGGTGGGAEFEAFDGGDIAAGLGTNVLLGGDDPGITVPEPDPETLPTEEPAVPPDAVDDAFATNEDTALSGAVTLNDTDPRGGALTATLVSGTANGALVFNADGTFTYTPNPDFNGADSFSYQITNPDGETDTATVSITVNPVPDIAPDAFVVAEDNALNGNVLDNDSYSGPVTVSSFAQPANGSVSVNADGTFTYTPNANFFGPDSFTYTTTDVNGANETTTVSITVTPEPDPVDDVSLDPEGAEASGSVNGNIFDNDIDLGDGNVMVTAVEGGVFDPNAGNEGLFVVETNLGGQLTLDADGNFVYTPPAQVQHTQPEFDESIVDDTITVTFTDGDGADFTQNIILTVLDTEPVAEDDAAATDEDTPVTVDVLANDTLGADPVTITSVAMAAGSEADGSVVIDNGKVTFTPAPGFEGATLVDYTITDSDGDSSSAQVTIIVAVDSEPTIGDEEGTVDEAEIVDTANGVFDIATGADSLASFTVNGQDVTAGGVVAGAFGSLAVTFDGSTYSWEYTLSDNTLAHSQPGTDSVLDNFALVVTDGDGDTDTGTITITVIDDVPVAVDDATTGDEDQDVIFNVLANDDQGADGATLTAASVNSGLGSVGFAADGTVTYTYGRQVGNSTSKFSECQLFAKQFPETSKIPQEGHFCNNANAALSRKLWEEHRFDEDLTGLEDLELAKRFVGSGLQVGYVAEASVLHLHEEDWPMVRRRYEREAIALQYIMPQIHVGFRDFVRYFVSAVLLDVSAATEQRVAMRKLREIVMFRLMQYWGTYQGNHEHRKSSREMKEVYFYPR